MELIKINDFKEDREQLNRAADVLESGGLVVFPTETVYGLGANANISESVSKIYSIKKRPKNKPLSLHISDVDFLFNYVDEIPLEIKKLADCFWPGPLTIVVSTKFGKKGFRMPDNHIALDLIKKSKVPVVAPSANISGDSPPKDVKQIPLSIKDKVDIIIDGGKTDIGIESTVLDVSCIPFKILRTGAINKETLEDILGKCVKI